MRQRLAIMVLPGSSVECEQSGTQILCTEGTSRRQSNEATRDRSITGHCITTERQSNLQHNSQPTWSTGVSTSVKSVTAQQYNCLNL